MPIIKNSKWKKNLHFQKLFIIEKPQVHKKLEQYNKSQCTHHPALTINSGTILFQLYPTDSILF